MKVVYLIYYFSKFTTFSPYTGMHMANAYYNLKLSSKGGKGGKDGKGGKGGKDGKGGKGPKFTTF